MCTAIYSFFLFIEEFFESEPMVLDEDLLNASNISDVPSISQLTLETSNVSLKSSANVSGIIDLSQHSIPSISQTEQNRTDAVKRLNNRKKIIALIGSYFKSGEKLPRLKKNYSAHFDEELDSDILLNLIICGQVCVNTRSETLAMRDTQFHKPFKPDEFAKK